jgi:hypothetical protein
MRIVEVSKLLGRERRNFVSGSRFIEQKQNLHLAIRTAPAGYEAVRRPIALTHIMIAPHALPEASTR